MARSPLLRSLRQILREVRAAKAADLPLDVVREERRARAASARLSRRQFLGGAATAGAVLSLPGRASAARTQPVVAVVGGGIGGLTCALALRDHGINSTVYEASGRIGGRMFSNTSTWAAGQVSEWGGELVDTGHRTVRRLARRYGIQMDDLPTFEPAGAAETFYFDGHYYSKADADRDFLEMADIVQADLDAAGYPTRYDDYTPAGAELDAMTVYEWIETRVPGGHSSPLGKVLDMAYVGEFGAETSAQSALNLLYLLAFQPDASSLALFGESDERFHMRGGNQRLPEAIAAELGDAVRTGHCLTRLTRTSGGRYGLTFQRAGRSCEVVADFVVLAIPFPVLEHVDTAGAGFDDLKRMAISDLGRGHNGKIILQFTNRGWLGTGPWPGVSNGSTFSDAGYVSSWDTSRGQAGTPGLLNLYSGGNATDALRANRPFVTVADASAAQDIQTGLQQIAKVYPGLTWNGRGTVSQFHLARHAGLSYAYYKPGQYTTFGGYEGAKQGNVYFCGEHTSGDFQGYMEGGAITGKDTAFELISAIRGNAPDSSNWPLRGRR